MVVITTMQLTPVLMTRYAGKGTAKLNELTQKATVEPETADSGDDAP